jgi:hypothetical protein
MTPRPASRQVAGFAPAWNLSFTTIPQELKGSADVAHAARLLA